MVVPRLNLLGYPVHGARELGGQGPLGGSQVAVARGERQPVLGPHSGHADYLDRHGHVGHHLANERQLLVILLAEAGHVGLHQVEQLGDDSADTTEVARAQRPFQQAGETRYLDEGLAGKPLGIHQLRGRGEHQIHAGGLQGGAVLLQGTGIVGEILGLVELQGVHEDADHHLVAAAAGLIDQGEMALVQIAHGGHECDGAAFAAPLADLFTQSGRIVHNQHQQFTFG